ncbi:MAG TPA: serine/threonine-protein kinase, partial [Kofleriaceae bacterium]|nr:serine/threonine-protein kinase [Kofleriaceae bacterium]
MARGEIVDGRYELREKRGSGAQGTVWAVDDLERGERCVLKVMAGSMTRGDGASERALVTEFAHLAQLSHPSLVRVRELASARTGPLAPGTIYFTADLIDGVPLADAAAPLRSPKSAAALARMIWSAASDLAGALAAVHAAGLLHHDVAPQNVLWVGTGEQARAVLLDLGLSTARRALGAARGTPAYLAPEALAGSAEPRSDLYALGATLWHAVRGAPPFGERDTASLVRAILRERAAILDELPAPLAEVIARTLAKSPDDRPSSAAAFADELESISASLDHLRRRRARASISPLASGSPDAFRAGPAPARGSPGVLAAPPVVGADDALAALARVLGARGGAARVWGPAGADLAEVTAEAIRRHQIEAIAGGRAPAPIARGSIDEVAASAAIDPGGHDGAAFVRRVARVMRAREGITIVELGGDARGEAFARALAAMTSGPGVVIASVAAESAPSPCPPVVDVAIGPADAAAIAR